MMPCLGRNIGDDHWRFIALNLTIIELTVLFLDLLSVKMGHM